MKIKSKIFFLMMMLSLSGCATEWGEDNSVLGIGKGRDDMKRSVCENCHKMDPFYENGAWVDTSWF